MSHQSGILHSLIFFYCEQITDTTTFDVRKMNQTTLTEECLILNGL